MIIILHLASRYQLDRNKFILNCI